MSISNTRLASRRKIPTSDKRPHCKVSAENNEAFIGFSVWSQEAYVTASNLFEWWGIFHKRWIQGVHPLP